MVSTCKRLICKAARVHCIQSILLSIKQSQYKKFHFNRIEDTLLGSGDIKFLKPKETRFWQELIPKYLLPLEKDAEKEKQVATGLKELRDMCVFSFLMINSIWVLAVFLLQEQKHIIYISWIFTDKDGDELQLEPIALVFMIFFVVGNILNLSFYFTGNLCR